jgi:hypothetical protein
VRADSISLALNFSPIIGDSALLLLVSAALLLTLISLFYYKKGVLIRTICAAAFLTILYSPSITEEEYEAVKDVAVIIEDSSPSQKYGKREDRSKKALEYLKSEISKNENLELRVVKAPLEDSVFQKETRLFDALEKTLSDVPEGRRAGAILITDGQVHDVPKDLSQNDDYGPLHVLLSGERDEKDRRIKIIKAPAYGIVGQTIAIEYIIEDTPNIEDHYTTLMIRQNNEMPKIDLVPSGRLQRFEVTLKHAGQNIIDLEASPVEGELTSANNRTQILVNGVRDRLRVLLVSGQPHAGGRTWRNILTSDPGVDLVHFTILREPNKLDATPQNELSLIAFPFRELFELKLYDFDLIVFDRYRLNRILPNYYFANIARYVKEGGALLEASGPSFADSNSIYTTALKEVLPAQPVGSVIETAFTPNLTDKGGKHPVTQNLRWNAALDDKPWGNWLRQISVMPTSGDILMNGAKNLPLLILDRVGEGRVAQLSSDHIWLWSRGYDGGGPQAELLRRLAHWLMKEPDLEENALTLEIKNDDRLIIKRRAIEKMELTATITAPSGEQSQVELSDNGKGWLIAEVPITEMGIYSVYDGTQSRFVIAGEINPPELGGVITTEEVLKPINDETKGAMIWLKNVPSPSVRYLTTGRDYDGKDWLGFRENNAKNITGVIDRPFLPNWFYALIILSLLICAWWSEGRKS